MRIPKYLVIRIDVHGTAVTFTDVSDRCKVYEYEYEAEAAEPKGKCVDCKHFMTTNLGIWCYGRDGCEMYSPWK